MNTEMLNLIQRISSSSWFFLRSHFVHVRERFDSVLLTRHNHLRSVFLPLNWILFRGWIFFIDLFHTQNGRWYFARAVHRNFQVWQNNHRVRHSKNTTQFHSSISLWLLVLAKPFTMVRLLKEDHSLAVVECVHLCRSSTLPPFLELFSQAVV